MSDLPDEVWGFTEWSWETLGYTPIILFRLIDRGWSYEEIDGSMRILVGDDYASIKASIWIERLEEKGIVLPEDISLVEILDRLIFVIVAENTFKG